MKNILDSSLRSTIRLSEIAEWKALIERVERFPARRDEAQEKEDLKNVRTAFGGHWIRYCEHLLEFQGLRPRLGRIEVNLVEETSMRDQKTVRLAVLAGKVATASLDELKQLAGEFAGPANDAERRYFSNWRMAMLSAGSVPPPDANPSSAHEYRYLGFTFALRDQRSLAHEAYEKAVWASKAEGEPLWLQHLTTSSAMVFNSEFERQIFGIGEPVDPRLREHQRAVALSDEVSVWSRRVNQALTATINSLREHEVSNTRVMGSPNIPALPLQQRMEQEWIAPAVIAPLAAAAGQLMLYGPEARKGVGLLAFYGDDKALPQYVRRLVRLQSTSGVEPGIIDELLSDSASFLEHAAKATALEQAVSELRDVEMVVAHVVSVLTSNKPSNHVGLSWRSDPYVEHRQLLESILKVHGPPQQAKATLALLEPSERSRTGVYLPWESWLIRGQIDGETAGDWWRLAHTRFRERCIEVALRAHQCGRDSGFFRELLDEVSAEPPTLDDAAFNRARAVLALSGADAQLSHLNSLAALVKSSSNSVPTGVLLALAERAETIDKQILKQVIIRRLENLESLGAHFWVGRNVREIEELLRVLAKVHKVGRSVELQRILFRWFEREPFFWAALREAQAFLRERTFRETTLRYLADAEVEKNNHQRMGLLGVSRFQSQDKSDLWWLSDALALTNATSPDVVADSLHVLSNDDAREALEGAGLVELVLATFHRVNRDGRAIVRAALVTAASHWAKKHERFGAMIESSSGDERALVRAALLEHEDRHVSPQIEDDQ